jgi:hypothetical protein
MAIPHEPPDRVDLQVQGPGHHKIMAAFEGADPITRIAIAQNDARVTVFKGRRKVHVGGRQGQGSGNGAVMYLLSGRKEDVKRSDDILRMVVALLETAGPDAVMERLTGSILPKEAHPTAALPPLSPPSPFLDAAHRWAERKDAMLQDNDTATASQLAGLTGSTAANKASRANEWRVDGRIFGVHSGRRLVYPLFQLKEGRPREVVGEVLRHLRPKMTDWEIFAWFTVPDTWSCHGRRPMDVLDHEPEAVVEAARHAGAETWD